MPTKKKKAAGTATRKKTRKKPVTRKATAARPGFVKGKSVISRRNQNGTVILMATYKTGSFFKLDGIAAEVWAALESPKTLDSVVDHFKKRYPPRAKSMGGDIDGLVKKLVKFELLSETRGPFDATFPSLTGHTVPPAAFGKVQEYDLLQIESEVLNESIYLDVFAGSDLRLKSDVTPIQDALAKVIQLDGITHRWSAKARAQGGADRAVHAGLIAQQVAIQMPELVRADRETGHLAVEYRKLNSYLVEAIKELHQVVVSQERRISKLEKKRTTRGA